MTPHFLIWSLGPKTGSVDGIWHQTDSMDRFYLGLEIEILRCVDHPCIIKLYDVYEDDWFIHLVTELCTGGELFDRIIQKTKSEESHYSEKDA
ncbi:unnamed protein product [Ascophyllum nodosum]